MYNADCLRFSNRQYSVTVRLWLVETNVADAHVKTRHLYGLYSYAASAGHCVAHNWAVHMHSPNVVPRTDFEGHTTSGVNNL